MHLEVQVTPNPNQEWVSQQARHLSSDLQAQSSQARFLICDNDKKFPFAFPHVLAREGVRGDPHIASGSQGQPPTRSAWWAALGESASIGPSSPAGVTWSGLLGEYVDLQRAASASRTSAPPPNGRVLEVCRAGDIECRSRLGGLLREYSRTPSLAAARVICTRQAFMSISGWSNSRRVGNHDA
jgi:hypothetical protein